MKRSIEDHDVKLTIGKGQVIEFRPKSREEKRQRLLVVLCGLKTILVICQEIDCDRCVALLRKAVAHPAITCAQVKNAKPRVREGNNAGQNLALDVAKRTSADGPLPAIASGEIAIGQRKVVVVAVTAPAFRGANILVVSDEALEV